MWYVSVVLIFRDLTTVSFITGVGGILWPRFFPSNLSFWFEKKSRCRIWSSYGSGGGILM